MGNIINLPRPALTGTDFRLGDEATSRDWTYQGTICALLPDAGHVRDINMIRRDGRGMVCLPVASVRRIPPKLAHMGAA